jgi:hypothetical protein
MAIINSKPKCIPCNKDFASQSGLTRHNGSKGHEKVENAPLLKIFSPKIVMIINSFLRKYRHNCWLCHFHNNRKDIYNEHLKSEEHCENFELKVVKKFKCPKDDCGQKFNSKQNLERHMRSVTHNMSKKEKTQFNIDTGRQVLINGCINEHFIYNLISKLDIIDFIKCIGYNGNIYDIKYQLKGETCFRYLQAKTISFSEGQNRYTMRTKGSSVYKNNTLLVGVDNKHKLFCLLLIDGNITVEKIAYYQDSKNKTKYSHLFYTKMKDFKINLIEKLKTSIILKDETEGLWKDQKTEYYSLLRLENKSTNNKVIYKPNIINIDAIDCFMNDFKVQHKSSTDNEFHLHRTNGKNKIKPYSDTDKIDLFVFEIITKENIDNFFIIPTKIMMKKGYIHSETNKQLGKISITLPFKKNKKWSDPDHWSLKYLNNFEYFDNNMIINL